LLDLVDVLMKLDDSDVLLTGRLLGLHETSGVVDAGDQAASDLGVKGTRVACLVDLENALHPGDDLVRGGVRRLVKVDDTIALELSEGSGGGRPAARQGREMVGLHVKLVVVLYKRGLASSIYQIALMFGFVLL
jgi:hypothetical protein